MKKKLRDLTKEEYEKWRKTYCEKLDCIDCPFHNVHCGCFNENCWVNYKDLHLDKVLNQEIEIEVEMPELTEDERVILRNIDKEFRYIARDEDGSFFLYEKKPIKMEDDYGTSGLAIMFPFQKLFKFVKWEDDEPYLIKDLLGDD